AWAAIGVSGISPPRRFDCLPYYSIPFRPDVWLVPRRLTGFSSERTSAVRLVADFSSRLPLGETSVTCCALIAAGRLRFEKTTITRVDAVTHRTLACEWQRQPSRCQRS